MIAAFVAGNLYALCAMTLLRTIDADRELRHRWHRQRWPVRVVLTVAWPVTACWLYRNSCSG